MILLVYECRLYSHISPDTSTLIKYPLNVRKRNEKLPSIPKKINYRLSSLENEVRRDLRYDEPTGLLCFWFQLPMPLWCWIKDLDLMVREYWPLWERQLPGKSGQP